MQLSSKSRSQGAATLLFSLLLITLTTLVIIFASNYAVSQGKSITNMNRSLQAYDAAAAGLEYGIAFLQTNSATVTASPSGGYINYSIATTTLANNSSYSVAITNPTANDYSLLRITSTGSSDDGTSTHVLSQLVGSGGTSLSYAITSKGSMVTSGNGNVTGSNNAINLGGTFTKSGTWNIPAANIKQNDTALSSMTSAQFFNFIFNTSSAAMQAQSAYYASSSGVPWSTLSGKVWINSSVIQSSTLTIGSAANPVILVINGSLISSGTVNIYGIVYTTGSITTSGNFNVYGAIVSQGPITMSGSIATYDSTVLSKLLGAGYYAKIPGSWKDF